MARYIWAVLVDATEGNEAEFERWYREEHLPEFLAVPGFGAGQLYRQRPAERTSMPTRYLSVIESETDDLDGMLDRMAALGKTAGPIPEAVDEASMAWGVFEPVGAHVRPKG